ncbi:MAG: hypothetical protein ACFB5Z_05110 [Elainellaceae cyanobacterium]
MITRITPTQIARWISLLALVASPIALSESAAAQELEGSIQAEFEDAFFGNDEDFFNNRSIARQVSFLLGIGFTDVEIVSSGENVHDVYEDVLRLQANSGPIILTPDLPNPYQTSVLLSPIVEDEVFVNQPLSQPIPAPVRRAPVQSGPIPALW